MAISQPSGGDYTPKNLLRSANGAHVTIMVVVLLVFAIIAYKHHMDPVGALAIGAAFTVYYFFKYCHRNSANNRKRAERQRRQLERDNRRRDEV